MDDDDHRYDDEEEEEEEGERLPPKVEDLAQASVPTSLKGLRACMRCGIIKTSDQFLEQGCENCPFLDMVRLVWFVVYTTLRWRLKSPHFCLLGHPTFLSFLMQAGNHPRCNVCTTAFFEGQVAVMDPGESWTVRIHICDATLDFYRTIILLCFRELQP